MTVIKSVMMLTAAFANPLVSSARHNNCLYGVTHHTASLLRQYPPISIFQKDSMGVQAKTALKKAQKVHTFETLVDMGMVC
jgi:hypothetical protein